MGKLLDDLNKQLERPEHKKNAEECIKVYNWIKSTDSEDRVWSSRWSPLVDVRYKGFPSDIRNYNLNITGKMVLKSIESLKLI